MKMAKRDTEHFISCPLSKYRKPEKHLSVFAPVTVFGSLNLLSAGYVNGSPALSYFCELWTLTTFWNLVQQRVNFRLIHLQGLSCPETFHSLIQADKLFFSKDRNNLQIRIYLALLRSFLQKIMLFFTLTAGFLLGFRFMVMTV